MLFNLPNRVFFLDQLYLLFMMLLQSGPEFPVAVWLFTDVIGILLFSLYGWPVGERLISCVSIHSMELLDLYKVTLLQNLISKREKKYIIYEHIPSPWLIVYFLPNCFDVTSKTLIEVCLKLNIFHYTFSMYDY